MAIELCKRARSIHREEKRRGMRAGHPRIASFEFFGGHTRDRGGGDADALEKVKNIEEQASIDRVRERERHLACSMLRLLTSISIGDWRGRGESRPLAASCEP
jgi:hypothetical protein